MGVGGARAAEADVVGSSDDIVPPPSLLAIESPDLPTWTVDLDETFKETKRHLRNLMAVMDVTHSWRHTGLIEVLRSEMLVRAPAVSHVGGARQRPAGPLPDSAVAAAAVPPARGAGGRAQESSVLGNRTWEAQIGETIRLVASLPEALRVNNFQVVHDDMVRDYRARSAYARYLVKLRQDLLVAQDQLNMQRERVQRASLLYFQYHKTVQINSFVEKRENEIVA